MPHLERRGKMSAVAAILHRCLASLAILQRLPVPPGKRALHLVFFKRQ